MKPQQKALRRMVAACIGLLGIFVQASAAAPIEIRVLNAKNGERVKNQKVSVAIKGTRDASEYITDTEGNISVDLDPAAEVFVATEWWTTCRKVATGVDPYIPVSRVVSEGVTVENSCGHISSETVKGKLIIFAKQSSWAQLIQK